MLLQPIHAASKIQIHMYIPSDDHDETYSVAPRAANAPLISPMPNASIFTNLNKNVYGFFCVCSGCHSEIVVQEEDVFLIVVIDFVVI